MALPPPIPNPQQSPNLHASKAIGLAIKALCIQIQHIAVAANLADLYNSTSQAHINASQKRREMLAAINYLETLERTIKNENPDAGKKSSRRKPTPAS